jgi:putative ABC transport system ATP-binding protein/macrolide transport system ATP-binding/permease protein/lipoprotein-releasing system ATP-binding protein
VILSAQSLTKRYGAARGYEAVRGASLELQAGEFVSIVGRSGSGKSTLLAMLGALTPPTEGTLLLDGTDVWELSETELATFRCRQIGFVFQFPSLLANLTALDNVAAPALLGRTMHSAEAYARAHNLLARVGLGDHADAYPGQMSGGEQRRVVIARALINSPRLLLADEPTSDLDEDTEGDIIDLLERLQQSDSFGLVLVTHNLRIAQHATRTYEMRQGILEATDLPPVSVEAESRPRRFGPAKILAELEPEMPAAARAPIGLGANLWRNVQSLMIGGAVVFLGILLIDFGLAKYQETQVRARGSRIAKLAEIALSSLQSEVQSVSDLGDGRYELAVYLWNATGDQPIYVMSPDMRGYVQVGKVWQELPLKPIDDGASGVLKIEGKLVYRYVFDARIAEFTQLLPHYMHVRFSDTMLVSPSSAPKDDVFERKDNYYVYLKPFDVSDDVVLRRLKFPGKPPVWIPMPPH